MKECPLDLNILIEAGEPGDPSKGGNGFGIITCKSRLGEIFITTTT